MSPPEGVLARKILSGRMAMNATSEATATTAATTSRERRSAEEICFSSGSDESGRSRATDPQATAERG